MSLAFVSIGVLASPTITMKEYNEGYRLGECDIYGDPIHAKCDRIFKTPLPIEDYVRLKYGDYEVVEYGVSYRDANGGPQFIIKLKPKSLDSSNTSK